MKNIAEEKPFDELVGRKKYIVKEFLRDEDAENKKILNIGCGFGWFEYYLKDKAGHMWSIEPDEDGLETVKKYLGNEEKITFMQGSAIELPFEDGFFDTVVSWDVIEHIPEGMERKMISEMCRVLKKGGAMYLTTPHHNFINCILDPAWFLTGHRHYTEKWMKRSVERKGKLKITDMYVKGGLSTSFNMLNLYIAKWIFRRKPFFTPYIYEIEDKGWKKKDGNNTLCVRAVKQS